MQFTPVSTLPRRLRDRGAEVWPGVLLSAALAVLATLVGTAFPIVGSALPAIAFGVVLGLLRRPGPRWQPGVTYSSKFLLQCAVVLLGAQLSLGSILVVGAESLPVMLASLLVCLLGAWWIGRMLGVHRRLRTLIGVGTGICGASAIAAVSPIIGALAGEVAYAVSVIFLFNILAVALFPLLGHALSLDPHTFGLLAGTAVNDTSSVVAAASVFSTAALGFAVVVKLVRTLMIIPISIGLSVIEAKRSTQGAPLTAGRVASFVPWFLVGFIAVALLNSAGAIPEGLHETLVQASVFLIATALAAIGLSTDVGAMREAGWRPLILGAVLWLLVTATSLGVRLATGWIEL